jgi:hypothetical protein
VAESLELSVLKAMVSLRIFAEVVTTGARFADLVPDSTDS